MPFGTSAQMVVRRSNPAKSLSTAALVTVLADLENSSHSRQGRGDQTRRPPFEWTQLYNTPLEDLVNCRTLDDAGPRNAALAAPVH